MKQEQVLTHFQSLNRTRIERLNALAPLQQRSFFELLPLLFHTNNDIIPYSFSSEPPAGIIDYQPTMSQLDAAKKLKHNFQFKRHSLKYYSILGLYLINDHGLLNYPQHPHYELWLVHDKSLDEAQQHALQKKMTTISKWADSLGINITPKLFSEISLNQQPLSNHKLDRFYLNGLVIAGALPLWWFIPPNDDIDEVKVTLDQRALSKLIILDFGEKTDVSNQSLYNDLVALLDSSLEHGIEHLLPLIYQQYYLRQFPNVPWLSNDFKRAIYQGEVNPLQLDRMSLMLKRLESANIPFNIMKLVRQSFYIHTKEPLSQKNSHPKFPWRRQFITHLSNAWPWDDDVFKQLDQRSKASFSQCISEHKETLPIFESISKSLKQFAEQQQLTLTQQQHLVTTKLQRKAEKTADIIESLPTGLVTKNNEEHLYLHRFEVHGDWKISNIALGSVEQIPLHQESSLLKILAWAVRNQLLTSTSRIRVTDNAEGVSISKIKPIIQQLLQSPLAHIFTVTNDALLEAPTLDHVLLFVNLEQQPMARFDKQGLKLFSLQNNPLNYADRGHSLIVSIESLICSSWGEWQLLRHTGTTSPLDMLTTLIPRPNPQHKSMTIACWCPEINYVSSISSYLEDLYIDIKAHYEKSASSGDYLLSIADNYYQLQWQVGLCSYSLLPHITDVSSALARARASFSASKVSPHLDPSGLLSALLRYQINSQISIFLQNNNPKLSLYLIDEFGSLFHQEFNNLTESTLIANFRHFISSIKERNKLEKVRFFRLEKNEKWQISLLPLPRIAAKKNYLPVIINMDKLGTSATCTIKCGPKYFSGRSNDPELFRQVSKLVISLRHSSNHYPLYIAELNFPQTINVTTRQYIMQKQYFENLLNAE